MARWLIACEFSGAIRRELVARGHDVLSCDLLPAEDGASMARSAVLGRHYQGDVRAILSDGSRFDAMVAHPPCTYLCVSGQHWKTRDPSRIGKTAEALDFVRLLMNAAIERIAVENPVSVISTQIRKPDQIIQPYEFGDDASKRTCLWLKGFKPLRIDPARRCAGRWVIDPRNGKRCERWSNQTDKGFNKLGPSADRWKERSITYPGIARAIAEQWG